MHVPTLGCKHQHVMRQLLPLPSLPSNYHCAGFDGCIKNEIISLHERHLQEVPTFDQSADKIWEEAFGLMRELIQPRPCVKMSQAQCILSAPQNRRKRMRNAYDNLNRYGWSDSYARVKAFGKWEKFDDSCYNLEEQAMRMIQHRSDEYCYTLARYLKPIEKSLLYRKVRQLRPFVKGMTPRQRARLLVERSSKYKQPCYILLDHSRYDAHLVEGIRRKARDYFCDFFPGDKKLRHLLTLQSNNKCVTRNGIRYRMKGTMCSGDYNTSLEDNAINYAIIERVFLGVRHDEIIDGDDSIVIIESSDLKYIDLSLFKRAAMTTKAEVVYDISDADFCQCKLVRTISGPLMVREPHRVMSRSSYTIKTYNTRKSYERLAKAIAMCEKSCNRGVPVLQAYADMLLRSFEHVDALKGELDEMLAIRNVRLSTESLEISEEARIDFFIAFGVPRHRQLEIESWFSQSVLPVTCA